MIYFSNSVWPFSDHFQHSAINLTFFEKNQKFYKSLHNHADAAAAFHHKNGSKCILWWWNNSIKLLDTFASNFIDLCLKNALLCFAAYQCGCCSSMQQHMKNGWPAYSFKSTQKMFFWSLAAVLFIFFEKNCIF